MSSNTPSAAARWKPAFRTRRRHQKSARQQKQRAAGLPHREVTFEGGRSNPSVPSSRFSVGKVRQSCHTDHRASRGAPFEPPHSSVQPDASVGHKRPRHLDTQPGCVNHRCESGFVELAFKMGKHMPDSPSKVRGTTSAYTGTEKSKHVRRARSFAMTEF